MDVQTVPPGPGPTPAGADIWLTGRALGRSVL
jgi:hypothetical protein